MRMRGRLLPALLLLSACAGSAGAAEEIGKKLFMGGVQPACGLCHALRDAGTEGAVGPSLDELKPDAARVAKALKSGIGQMPAFSQLSEEQIQAISRYVAQAAGR
jgi:cytochrome c6